MLETVTAQVGLAMYAEGCPVALWDLNSNWGICEVFLMDEFRDFLLSYSEVSWRYLWIGEDLVTEHVYEVTYQIDSSADLWLGDGKGAIKSPWIA